MMQTKVGLLWPKPALVKSQRVRQLNLCAVGLQTDSRYATPLEEWIQLSMSADEFTAWFPRRICALYAQWRGDKVDTRLDEAGPEWRAVPVERGHIWLSAPRPAHKMYAPAGYKLLTMEGEHWVQLSESEEEAQEQGKCATPIELIGDRWRGEALGPIMWIEVYSKGQSCEVRMLCASFATSEAAITKHFYELRMFAAGAGAGAGAYIYPPAKAGRPIGAKDKGLSDDEQAARIATIKQMLSQGKSYAQIGVKLSISKSRVAQLIREHNIIERRQPTV